MTNLSKVYSTCIYIYIYIYMCVFLGENEFLPKKFKLCSNLSLFSNYLASCSCFGTWFFENWVPHITQFYHFLIMWKFCRTGIAALPVLKNSSWNSISLKSSSIENCYYYYFVSLFAISISEFFAILEGKKKCNPILNILSLSEILEPAHTLLPFL